MNQKNTPWDKLIPEWEKNIFYDQNNILFNWLLKYRKKSDKILDQGTGIGQYALSAYKFGFKNIVGLDYSSELIKTARRLNKKLNYKCKFIEGDIRKMPLKEKSFDIVLSGGIIEHVPETEKTISEISRVLKNKGYLLIHVPHKISIFTILKKIQQFLGIWKLGYEKSFTIKELSNLFEKYQLEILEFRIKQFEPGNHKIIGKIIQILDKPLYKLGYGGHHMSFLCRKK